MDISWKIFLKIWVYLTRLSTFSEFMQIPNFLLSANYFFWPQSQQVGHLTQGWRRRALNKRNSLEPFYLYAENTSYS